MATIDNLTLEITADSSKATTSLNNLAGALAKLKTNLPTKAKLEGTAEGFKTLATAISKLSLSNRSLEQIKAIGKIGNALSKISQVSPSNIQKTATNLDSLQGAISHLSMEGVERIERLAKAFEKFGMANKNMGAIRNVTKMTNMVSNANAPIETTVSNATGGVKTGDVEKLKETVGLLGTLKSVASGISPILKVVGGAFSLFGSVIKRITAPVRNFVRALARIAFYRFIRSILKSITQGLKEGIQNLALYSKALNELDAHSANNVLSRYASEFLYFKNAVATAVIPVLRALIPYVETAINRIIDFVNVIAQVGSAFFGDSFTKAKYFWVDYADSLDNASGKAKKLHHQLAQFDELNNLTDNQSGGRGTDKLEDASNMFEEALINSKILTFVDNLKTKLTDTFNRVKTITKPFFDRIKEMAGEIKQKVLPNLKRIYENLKKIWENFLKPILDEFLAGFFEGFTGEAFKSLPDTLATITDKVADFSDKLVELTGKIPIDKVKDFAHKLGELLGKVTGFYKPYTWAVNALPTIKDLIKGLIEKTWEWSKKLADLITKFLGLQNPTSTINTFWNILKSTAENLYLKIKSLNEWLKDLCDKTLNLHEPTSVLSTKINDLKDKVSILTDKNTSLKEKLEALSPKFTDIKDKAKALYDKLKDLADKFTSVKDTASTVKTYFDNNSVFDKNKTNAEKYASVLTTICDVFDKLKKIGTVTISLVLKLTGLDTVADKVGDFAEKVGADDLADKMHTLAKTSTSSKDTNQERAQLPTTTPTTEKPKTLADFGGNVGEYQAYMRSKLKGYASGGYPSGDLFIANERGAEMVGSIGGKTAVANNDQITEAIAQATYTAMSKALAENGGQVNIVVEGDGDKMFKVFQKKQRDYQRATGLAY